MNSMIEFANRLIKNGNRCKMNEDMAPGGISLVNMGTLWPKKWTVWAILQTIWITLGTVWWRVYRKCADSHQKKMCMSGATYVIHIKQKQVQRRGGSRGRRQGSFFDDCQWTSSTQNLWTVWGKLWTVWLNLRTVWSKTGTVVKWIRIWPQYNSIPNFGSAKIILKPIWK